MQNCINRRIIHKVIKLFIFFSIIFILLFCITWQNIHIYLMEREIIGLTQKRNELEKKIYLKNIDLSNLRSRDRIKRIAQDDLDMVPISYKDVKLIVY